MDDKLIRLLIGGAFPFLFCLFWFFVLCYSIRDLIALYRSRNEPFNPVECEVVSYGYSDDPHEHYFLRVKRLDNIISRKIVPCNCEEYTSVRVAKKYIGTHLTLYAKDSAPRHLYYEKDISSPKTMTKEIRGTIFVIFVALFILLLGSFYIIHAANHIYQ